MECLLPYLCMVTVPHIMIGLERMLDYRGVGLERMLDYRGVRLARFHCTPLLILTNLFVPHVDSIWYTISAEHILVQANHTSGKNSLQWWACVFVLCNNGFIVCTYICTYVLHHTVECMY